MQQNHQLDKAKGRFLNSPNSYRRLLGRLIFLTISRLDLTYFIQVLAQFMHQPWNDYWNATIRVLHYLKGSHRQGFLLRSTTSLQIRVFCDLDWASGCCLTCYFISLGHSPISLKRKKQHTDSWYSVEAKYHSMVMTSCELKWLKSLLKDFRVSLTNPTPLFLW